MSRAALARSVAVLEEQDEDAEADRYVDLCMSLRICDVDPVTQKWKPETDVELLEVGGVWDRREKAYTEREPRTVCIVRVHPGQAEAARELADWLWLRSQGARGPHWDAVWRYWTFLLVGGRRGGKTHLACIALALFMVLEPGSRLFAASPTLERGDELEAAIKSVLPRRWYRHRGGGSGKASQFRLINGSRLLAVSGHKAGSLKAGRVDLALYNEGQQMSKKGWLQLRGGCSDRGGLVIVAANPPDEPIGRWIEVLYEDAMKQKAVLAGGAEPKDKLSKVKAFTLTAKDNPFVEWASLLDLEADAKDDREFRREVLGEFVPIGDVVHHQWRDSDHWRDPDPAWTDITVEFTREKLGQAFGFVVGEDFQLTPAMIGLVCKVFRDQDGEEILAVVDEAVVDKANEEMLCDELESMPRWGEPPRPGENYRGWALPSDEAPVHCGVVMDATGFHQDGEHQKGRTSELALRSKNWKHLFRPIAEKKVNPELTDRSKVVNARLRAQNGKVRVIVAKHCTRTARSMRLWELKNGLPYKRSDHAHIGDAIGYVIYRFWGKPRVKGAPSYESVRRFSRRSEMKGI